MSGIQGIDEAVERSYPTPYDASPLLPMLLLSLATQKHAPYTKKTFKEEYDYIIIGAGSAGSVVASRLSEKPCVNVLLLEAGHPPPMLTDVPALARNFLFTDIDWQYKTTPQKHSAGCHVNRQVTWPSGKTLGGSSTLNAMLYVRGNHKNYDSWAEGGAVGWSYKDVLPYFLRLEDNMDIFYLNKDYHDIGGPVTVEKPAFNPDAKQAAKEAISNLGYRFVDPNGPTQHGFYDYQATVRKGQRCSTSKAYLVPADNRTNLDILANARVRKILIKDKKAVGVEFDFEGITRQVTANREVILSAGTTNSAQLLMLSGIGPAEKLKEFDIPVVEDLPVGKNFQDHCGPFIFYELDDSLESFESMLKNETNVRRYVNTKTGPLTASEGIDLMSFLSSQGRTAMNDVVDYTLYLFDFVKMVPVKQLGLRPDVIEKVLVPSANKTVISCGPQLLHPRSRGTVSIMSKDPYDPPLIDPNYLEDIRDVKVLIEGLKLCKEILESPAMKKIGAKSPPGVIPDCEALVQNEEKYFECLSRCITITLNHQVGTAKMGDPNDPLTVVDPQLRVKNVMNLRVVDASVMPTVPWGNTNIPTIMIAEKASDIIKATIQC